MRLTKSQLKQIIVEERDKVFTERGTGNPALQSEEQVLRSAITNFADKYMMTMGMNPGDPADIKRVRRTVDDMLDAIMGVA